MVVVDNRGIPGWLIGGTYVNVLKKLAYFLYSVCPPPPPPKEEIYTIVAFYFLFFTAVEILRLFFLLHSFFIFFIFKSMWIILSCYFFILFFIHIESCTDDICKINRYPMGGLSYFIISNWWSLCLFRERRYTVFWRGPWSQKAHRSIGAYGGSRCTYQTMDFYWN